MAIDLRNGAEGAFPGQPWSYDTPAGDYRPGLTKRELFAALAMQGLAGAYSDGGNFHEQHVAMGAVKIADALLAELEKPRG